MNRLFANGTISLAAAVTIAGCGQTESAAMGDTAAEQRQSPEAAAEIVEAINARREKFSDAAAVDGTSAHRFVFEGLMAPVIPMAAFAGEVVLVVNTASKCGFTPQYSALQAIHEQYASEGFSVLGVPSNDFGGQEPGSADDIREFCELNYGVTFPLAAKTPVRGGEAHDFYKWARMSFGEAAAPQWNFHKILIDRSGVIIGAFPSGVKPDSDLIKEAIEAALATPA
ncbi:MAG: glutathione peroxidase [Pseudomonadota bacterium]